MTKQEQAARRAELYSLLGRLPQRDCPLSCRTVAVEERENYIMEKLVLELAVDPAEELHNEPIPAYFVRPKGEGPFPGVLFNHSHGSHYEVGKDELPAPLGHMCRPDYATLLTGMGYAVLCIDTWCFGERSGRSESATFKKMLWNGEVMWGHMVYENIRALDYLCSRPDVDPSRIATLGMSMGSTMGWWTAALDERIKVTVDLCCLTDYDALAQENGFDRHGIYYYVPSLTRHFTSPQINMLIAPRAHLGTVGNYDQLTPPAGVDRIEREVGAVYAEMGAPENFTVLRYPIGHRESAAMRADIIEYLRAHL